MDFDESWFMSWQGNSEYIEVTSGIPRERVEHKAKSTGKIQLAVGTISSGQGP